MRRRFFGSNPRQAGTQEVEKKRATTMHQGCAAVWKFSPPHFGNSQSSLEGKTLPLDLPERRMNMRMKDRERAKEDSSGKRSKADVIRVEETYGIPNDRERSASSYLAI
ncbi:hypothetical protein LOAG_01859 [Loa loa]|uniref:Uncharacterized protein n=1 Tax=Loa loa TaxID=7209 RepID=A0A1S0U9W6_LOALO|nr:hypothetical protein LOAG_01859 [Loa loa]EFO26620.1 hypothetical protein LOAG_01859 [Loa loa]